MLKKSVNLLKIVIVIMIELSISRNGQQLSGVSKCDQKKNATYLEKKIIKINES